MVIRDNPAIRNLSNLKTIFSEDYFSTAKEITYRPISTVTYFINYACWQLNPAGYRISSLLIHALNSILVFLLVAKLFPLRPALPFITALLFCALPVNNETILVTSFNEDLLVFLFGTLFFFSYIKYVEHKNKNLLFISLLAFTLALFSKESAVVLLALIPAYNLMSPKSRKKPLPAVYFLSIALITVFYIWIQFFVMKVPNPAPATYPGGSFYTNMLTMSKVFINYLGLYIYPANLCAEHIIPVSTSLRDFKVIFSLILIVLILLSLKFVYKISKPFFFGLLWLLLGLAPVMNFIPFLNVSLLAERYMYFSSFGFCLMAGSLLILIKNPKIRNVILVCIITFYSYVVITRNNDWKDHSTLWAKTLSQSPGSTRAHTNIGLDYLNAGQIDTALAEFQEAVRLFPKNTVAWANMGDAYLRKGDFEKALEACKKSIEIDNANIVAYNNMGIAYAKMQKFKEAEYCFKKIIELDPNNVSAYDNLACAYAINGNYDAAIKEFQNALSLTPDSPALQAKLQRAMKDKQNNK